MPPLKNSRVSLGTGALATTPVPIVGSFGLFLIGLLESPVKPVLCSLAARAAPEHIGRAVSTVWGAFYVAFLAGPLLTGGVADLFGLRLPLALFVLTPLAIAGCSYDAGFKLLGCRMATDKSPYQRVLISNLPRLLGGKETSEVMSCDFAAGISTDRTKRITLTKYEMLGAG